MQLKDRYIAYRQQASQHVKRIWVDKSNLQKDIEHIA